MPCLEVVLGLIDCLNSEIISYLLLNQELEAVILALRSHSLIGMSSRQFYLCLGDFTWERLMPIPVAFEEFFCLRWLLASSKF